MAFQPLKFTQCNEKAVDSEQKDLIIVYKCKY